MWILAVFPLNRPQESGKKGPPGNQSKDPEDTHPPAPSPAKQLGGSSELVSTGDDREVPEMADLQEKLLRAQEARMKLRELQEAMGLLQEMVWLTP